LDYVSSLSGVHQKFAVCLECRGELDLSGSDYDHIAIVGLHLKSISSNVKSGYPNFGIVEQYLAFRSGALRGQSDRRDEENRRAQEGAQIHEIIPVTAQQSTTLFKWPQCAKVPVRAVRQLTA
jgi:hypothetical protein